MKVLVGYPASMKDSLLLETLFSKLTVQKNDFYRNVVYGAKYLRYMDKEALVSPVDEHRWRHVLNTRTVDYVYQANLLGLLLIIIYVILRFGFRNSYFLLISIFYLFIHFISFIYFIPFNYFLNIVLFI